MEPFVLAPPFMEPSELRHFRQIRPEVRIFLDRPPHLRRLVLRIPEMLCRPIPGTRTFRWVPRLKGISPGQGDEQIFIGVAEVREDAVYVKSDFHESLL